MQQNTITVTKIHDTESGGSLFHQCDDKTASPVTGTHFQFIGLKRSGVGVSR